jgi:GAF domain-containing protein
MEAMTDEQQPALSESADEELARLRRLAIVDDLLTTLVGVVDVREMFAQVSEVAGRVLKHDAIALPVITEDRQHVIPFATAAGPAAVAYPSSRPIPEAARYLFTVPWEFEIVDDLQADPDRERHSASLGYRSMLRVPIRLRGEVIALLVVLSRTPAVYRPADAVVARRIADYVALALSHQRSPIAHGPSRSCEPERPPSSCSTTCSQR